MARYLTSISVTIAGLVGIFLLLFSFQLGAPTESSRWIHESYGVKSRAALSIDEPKLLVVGGSSAHFGVRAERIAAATGTPSVNIGLHAGLGLRYILDNVRDLARPGDTVLLVIEYPMYGDTRFGEVSIDYILSRDAEYYSALPILDKLRIAASTKSSRVLDGVRTAADPGFEIAGSIRYDAKTINEFGDETSHTATDADRRAIARLEPAFFRHDPEASAFGIIERFLDWAGTNKIAVLVSYPPLLEFDEYETASYGAFFAAIDEYWQTRNVVVLGSAKESMYPEDAMFDTRYHLNESGANDHTRTIIRQLSALPDR